MGTLGSGGSRIPFGREGAGVRGGGWLGGEDEYGGWEVSGIIFPFW